MRRLLYLLPVLLVAVLVAIFWRGLDPQRDPGALPSALIGKPAPALELPALLAGGAPLSLAALKGQPVAVNFFASWCLPCRAEHPLLDKIAKEHGIAVIGVAYKDKAEDARRYLAELGDPYAMTGLDESGRAGIEFGLTGVPETYVIDRDGIVRYRLAGPIAPDNLEDQLAPAIQAVMQ
jgi:cytochrome c biogenesis protein CcmG, thiol:disulfide interchange protein DsbE